MCATGAEHFRENYNENGRNFAKINYFRMSFEIFAKEILRKFGNPTQLRNKATFSKDICSTPTTPLNSPLISELSNNGLM